MENKAKTGGNKVVNLILNIIIIILSFVLVITVGVMIGEFSDATTYVYGEDNFYYDIEGERFFDMVGDYHSNAQAGYEGNKNMKEYYGVAEYYEAASLYRAYTVTGNTEWADFFKEKMNQAEPQMGGWSITKDAIHAQLGIE